MSQTTTTLAGTEVNKDALYLVDFNKLSSVEDLVLLFACLGLSFSGHHPHFETIKKFLDLSNPIQPNQPLPQQPKAENIKLPTLKNNEDKESQIKTFDKTLQQLYYQLGDPNVKDKTKVKSDFEAVVRTRQKLIDEINLKVIKG